MNKTCSKCGRTLSVTGFHKNASSKDGLYSQCKDCVAAKSKKYRQLPGVKKRRTAYLREWKKGDVHKEWRSKWNREYRSIPEVREKHAANRAVSKAVDRGKLAPASSCRCVDCGDQATHYHHESYAYDMRLEVVPLCVACHRGRHSASPTPQVIDHYSIDGADDDPSSGGSDAV